MKGGASMSMRAPLLGDDPIPEETARVAKSAFPKGNTYTQLRDRFGQLYQNADFVHLFAHDGQPAIAPARLALVSVMQYMEGVGDRQAADLVRDRISWKYALGLELADPGFHYSVLSEFRDRLLSDDPTLLLFDTVLALFREQGLLKARTKQRSDSTHVLAAVRGLSRLEHLGETLRATLNQLVECAPNWLRRVAEPAWVERYDAPSEHFRLPKSEAKRSALALTIGQDGYRLLSLCWAAEAPPAVRAAPLVEHLRRVWVQQFYRSDDPEAPLLCLRTSEDQPPSAQLLVSPYDADARFSTKREMGWNGYKLHLSETCDDDTPNLVTNVLTTAATTPDCLMTSAIHEALAGRDLLPSEHYLDAGYVDGGVLVASERDYQVEVVGPIIRDPSWQARTPGGITQNQFTIDWEQQQVLCPAGVRSAWWNAETDKGGKRVVVVQFPGGSCQVCGRREGCTKAKLGGRTLTLRPREEHAAIQAGREQQAGKEFRKRYGRRAGVEGTFSQGDRRCDLRHARYWGLAKVHLQHLLTAVALNMYRAIAWLAEVPRSKTRTTAFARLMAKPLSAVPA
jgi:transposase